MKMDKKLSDLRQKIIKTFPKNKPLPCIYLTAHRCNECDGLRDDFCGRKWWMIDGTIINDNYDKLPLFTAPAYHYYLPSFLLHAIDTFSGDNLVIEFIIYSLGPPEKTSEDRFFRERRAFFSETESSVIRNFLKCILDEKEMIDFRLGASRALSDFWQK